MTTYAALLSRSRIADQGFYLLIDPQADCDEDHALHPDNLLARFATDAVEPVLRADLTHDLSACPRLITLANAGQTLDEDYLRMTVNVALAEHIGGKRLICGWLSSPSPLTVVAEHLAQRCLVAEQNAQRVVPFFEPLRLELLAVSLRDSIGPWLWPISQWIVPSSGGRLLHLSGNGNAPVPSLGVAEISAQTLAPMVGTVISAWQQLVKQPMRANKRALAPLLRETPGPAIHAAAKVLAHLRRSHALGLGKAQDRMTFALQHLTVNPHLEAHPRIQQCIQEAAAGKTSLENAFGALDRAEWHDVLATLTRTRS